MKPTSFRFSKYTEAQLQRLCVAHELQRNIVVALALERFEVQTLSKLPSDVTVEIEENGVITEAEMLKFRALLQQ